MNAVRQLLKNKRTWLWIGGIAAIVGSIVGGAVGVRVWQIHHRVEFYKHDPMLFDAYRGQTVRVGQKRHDVIGADAVTCRTCHRHPGWFGQIPPLRDDVAQSFCARCHGDEAQSLHDRFHAIAAEREAELRHR